MYSLQSLAYFSSLAWGLIRGLLKERGAEIKGKRNRQMILRG
jgi:hypothetical protein